MLSFMSDSLAPLGCLVVGGLLLWGAYSAAQWVFAGGDGNGEREGTVKYADCREIIRYNERPFTERFRPYTCDYNRNMAGKIISGVCVRVEYAGDSCSVARVYFRKSDVICQAGYWPNPEGVNCLGPPPPSEVK